MFKPGENINEICPSCHPSQHIKTLAKFTGEYDEATKEYTYACIKCDSKIWATEQWIKDNEVIEGGDEMERKETVRHLVFETNHEAYALSANMENLEVIQTTVAQLLQRIEDITYKKWDEDPAMAQLSICEIKNTVRLIDMAFNPLFSTINEDVEKLSTHTNELFNILIKQADANEKSRRNLEEYISKSCEFVSCESKPDNSSDTIFKNKKSSLPSAMSKKQIK